ncbi:MAG: hypothetical protein PVH61_02060 [Candidatus Aminicenantes bacterium]|jgi:hypothetical protein
MEIISIRYCFIVGKEPDRVEEVFDLQLDAKNLELQGNIPKVLPGWAKLDFFQCSNCPLDVREHPYCPMAANLVNIVNRFDSLLSYNEIHVVVTTKERTISQLTTIQRAVGSLMGLVIATCGCPHSIFFKPMARFHLPLANNQETIYRAASMYLLAQYFLRKKGKPVDWDLSGLEKIYTNIQVVNYTIAERLRAATKSDSVLNALVELDIFAQTLSLVIEDSLEEIGFLFDSYLNPGK